MNKCFVFSRNKEKVEELFEKILSSKATEVEEYSKSSYRMLIKTESWVYEWTPLAENLRAIKCKKAYVDRDVDCEMFNMIMSCCMYCEEEEIKYF